MPDKSNYDLEFRPSSYFEPCDPVVEIISRVKGEQRRRWLKELLEADESEEVSDFLVKEELSDEERRTLGRCHPQFMGGEYLPSLKREEIEIARVSLNSTLGDVISIRARRRGETIHYKIVDDYYSEGIRYKYRPQKSRCPLTMYELIGLIDSVRVIGDDNWGGGLTNSFRNRLARNGPPEVFVDFVSVTSEFYPELEDYYREEALEWLEEFRRETNKEQEV